MEVNIYKKIFEGTNIGIAYHEMLFDQANRPVDYKYIDVNNAFCFYTGLEGKGVIGKCILDVLPEIVNDDFDWIGYYGDLVLDDRNASLEQYSRMLKKWFRIDVVTFDNRYFLTSFTDITSQKSEEISRINKQRVQYELSISGSNDGYWDWNILTNALECSDRWKSLLGYEEGEVEKNFETFVLLIDDRDKQRVTDTIKAYLEGEIPKYDIEFRMVRKDGTVIWTRARGAVVRDENGNPIRMSGGYTDVTELKNKEESLQKKDNILMAVAEAMKVLLEGKDLKQMLADSLTVLGKATQVDRVYLFQNDLSGENPVTSQIFEYVGEGIEAQMDNESLQNLPFEMISDFTEILQEGRVISGVPKDFGTDVRANLESQGIQSLLVFPIFLGDDFWGFVGFDSCKVLRKWSNSEKAILESFVYSLERGIERELILEILEEEKNKSEAANISKSMFLANMSHEIRTPINGLIGMLSLLEYTKLDKEQKSYVKEAKSSSEILLYLINDILDLSKIEAGKLVLEQIEFDIFACIEEAVSSFRARAEEKHLELNLSIDESIPTYGIGDPSRLRQVLNNLLSNAIKFTEKGNITVQVELLESDKNMELVFRVIDTGVGMSSETKAQIFRPFEQGNLSVSRKYGGTGLGLAISKQIVNMMDGDIVVKSSKGEGSLFQFTVKLEKKPVKSAKIEEEFDYLKNKRVLLFDNQKDNRLILKQYLVEAGIAVDEAKSSGDALELILKRKMKKEVYDVVIIDKGNSEVDYMSFLAMASQLDEDGLAKYMLATPLSGKENIRKLTDQGFHACIEKPIKKNDFLKKISLVLHMEDTLWKTEVNPLPIQKDYIQSRKPKILIAEDNMVNQKVVSKTLEKEGYESDVVTNGKQALEAWEKNNYDIIFMDCQMPVMDGYISTRKIREHPKGKRVKIVAMTAYAMEGDAQKCFAAGMDEYLSKPIDFDMLLQILKTVRVDSEDTPTFIEEAKQEFTMLTNFAKEDVEELFDDFSNVFGSSIGELELNLARKEYQRLSQTAHQMKGAASNLRIIEFADLFRKIELAAKEKNDQVCEKVIDKLKELSHIV